METETVKFELPITELRGGNYLVCVAFTYKESAKAALEILKSKGIEASLCELRPYSEMRLVWPQ